VLYITKVYGKQILQTDGNDIDACSYAVYVALRNTRVPKIEVIMSESIEPDDFEVCSDMSQATPIDCSDYPICVTVSKASDRGGGA
jgi:exosome complex RNA-binding protein Rrp42 (RNase PH superfamily)